LQAADANLHGGAVSGGTAGIDQQLIFRPLPGLGRAETPRFHQPRLAFVRVYP
jgi:hypothetical protein